MRNEEIVIHIRLNKSLHKELKTEAAKQETSMTDLIGQAVKVYLNQMVTE